MGPLFCAEPVHAEPTRARRTPARLDMEQAPTEARNPAEIDRRAPQAPPASTSTDQPPPRSSPHLPTRPPRRPTATRAPTPPMVPYIGYFPVGAVFSANRKTRYDARTSYSHKNFSAVFSAKPKSRYDARANYSKSFFVPFFQRLRILAMMRAQATREVFPAARETRHDARANTPELPHGRFFSDFRKPS